MSLDDKVKIMSIPCILVLTTRRGISVGPHGFGGPGGPPAGAPLPGGPMGPGGGCRLNGDGGSKPNVVVYKGQNSYGSGYGDSIDSPSRRGKYQKGQLRKLGVSKKLRPLIVVTIVLEMSFI